MPYELYEFDTHKKRRKKKPSFRPNHEDCKKAIKKFLKKGGTIKRVDYHPSFYEVIGSFRSPSQRGLMEMLP